MRETAQRVGVGRILGIGLVLIVLFVGALQLWGGSDIAGAQGEETEIVPADQLVEQAEAMMELETTELIVEGVGSRRVNYDGATARFTVSVLRSSPGQAVSEGNQTINAIAEQVEKQCTTDEPADADHTADPTCISPSGLQTVGVGMHEEFDWTDSGRVSQGFRYENHLSISIRGTGFAGGLVDLFIAGGGENVRFDSLQFTVSRRAEIERLALLDAIDDARSTAASIAKHLNHDLVRLVRVSRSTSFASPIYEFEQARAEPAADAAFTPTPVFGGSEVVTSQVQLVYELRPRV